MKFVLTLLKVSLSLALIFWLVKSGKIEMSYLAESLSHKTSIMMAILSFCFILLLSSFRDFILFNQILNNSLSYKKILSIDWIASFFNIILPGAVSGDVVKVFLIKRVFPQLSLLKLSMAILLSRLIGLIALLILSGLSSIFQLLQNSEIPLKLNQLYLFNVLLMSASLFFILFCFFPVKWQRPIQAKFQGTKFHKIFDVIFFVSSTNVRKLILPTIFLSIVCHLFTIFSFTILAQTIDQNYHNISQILSGVPLGFVITAIPIAPAGIGVGHFAFEEILKLQSIANGANFFNVYLIWWIIFSMTGVIPYMFTDFKFGQLKDKNL